MKHIALLVGVAVAACAPHPAPPSVAPITVYAPPLGPVSAPAPESVPSAKPLTKKQQAELAKQQAEAAEKAKAERERSAKIAAEQAEFQRTWAAKREYALAQCQYEVTGNREANRGGLLYQMAAYQNLMELCMRAKMSGP